MSLFMAFSEERIKFSDVSVINLWEQSLLMLTHSGRGRHMRWSDDVNNEWETLTVFRFPVSGFPNIIPKMTPWPILKLWKRRLAWSSLEVLNYPLPRSWAAHSHSHSIRRAMEKEAMKANSVICIRGHRVGLRLPTFSGENRSIHGQYL